MIPSNKLSQDTSNTDFLSRERVSDLVDFELGGVGLQDVSGGLNSKEWSCYYSDNQIILDDGNGFTQTVITLSGITQLSFCFSISMIYYIAYTTELGCFLYWYDTTTNAYSTLKLPDGTSNPQLSLDERRYFNLSNSDVILSYTNGEQLICRNQRDRFGVEYLLSESFSGKLVQTGMAKNGRFCFKFEEWK